MAMPESPKITAAQRADQDAYTLVRFQEMKDENAVIRKDTKRFNAAVKVIKKENEDRRKAMKKTNAARSEAVKP